MTTRATAICAESEELRKRMFDAVNGRRLVAVYERLEEQIPANAECVVLGLGGSERRRRLEVLVRQPAVQRAPVIVVSDAPLPEWFRRRLAPLARIRVKQIEHELLALVIHAICSRERERMRQEARRASQVPLVRRAIVVALTASAEKPLRLPRELAAALDVTLTALDDAFRAATGGRFTPGHLLSALQVVRALELRTQRSWTAAASAIGFSRRSLSRKAQAWPGCTLRELDAWGAPAILALFEREYLHPMLDAA